jgi:hypothetical protein
VRSHVSRCPQECRKLHRQLVTIGTTRPRARVSGHGNLPSGGHELPARGHRRQRDRGRCRRPPSTRRSRAPTTEITGRRSRIPSLAPFGATSGWGARAHHGHSVLTVGANRRAFRPTEPSFRQVGATTVKCSRAHGSPSEATVRASGTDDVQPHPSARRLPAHWLTADALTGALAPCLRLRHRRHAMPPHRTSPLRVGRRTGSIRRTYSRVLGIGAARCCARSWAELSRRVLGRKEGEHRVEHLLAESPVFRRCVRPGRG